MHLEYNHHTHSLKMKTPLYDIIRAAKPNVSSSTITTYVSLLTSTFYKHNPRDVPFNIDWYKDQDRILELSNDYKTSTRKTLMAAIISIVPDTPKYKIAMLEGMKKTANESIKQEKSEREATNWKDFDEIKSIYKEYEAKTKPLLSPKAKNLTNEELSNLSNFILMALASGVYIAPRRSTDWTEMKIRNWTDTENYVDMKRNVFVFRIFKTSKSYNGEQEIAIPPKLKNMLKKYIAKNPSDYLLVSNRITKLSPSSITQILNKMYGGLHISTSMLRHIYLSNKLKDVPRLEELTNLADSMGHSVSTQLRYIKH